MARERYKCRLCFHIVDSTPCPVCGNPEPAPMCPRDHAHCAHDVVNGIAYCPECGAAVCPICGCHDVAQVSRITGYLSDVAGWNAAKRQELKDRVRVEVGP